MDILERTTQDILQVQDTKIYKTLEKSNGTFNSIWSSLSDFSGAAKSYFGVAKYSQASMVTELTKLNGAVSGLSNTISSSVGDVKAEVAVINSKYLPSISTSLDSIKTSMTELVSISRRNADVQSKMANLGQNTKEQDYSGVFNNIESFVSDLKRQMSNVNVDVNIDKLYPALGKDLSVLSGAMHDLADAYTENGELDLDGFISNLHSEIVSLVKEFGDGILRDMTPQIINTFGSFVSEFTGGFTRAFNEEANKLNNQLNRAYSAIATSNDALDADTMGKIPNIISQFHSDVNDRLTAIDQHFSENVVALGNTIQKGNYDQATFNRKSSKQTGGGIKDIIDSFDEGSGKISSTSTKGTSILKGALGSIAGSIKTFFAAYISGEAISKRLNMIHNDTTDLIKATGLQRKAASDLQSEIKVNMRGTFGKSTFSQDEIESALQAAVRTGAVTAEHLKQASEATLAYASILPDVTLDLSQGWGKAIMTANDNGDDYLENIALSIDNYANRFYVSAGKLEKAVEQYTYSAMIFTNDFKGFSKAMNTWVGIQAAQENAGIMSMDLEDFLMQAAYTPMSEWSDAMRMRMTMDLGVAGKDMFAVLDAVRKGGDDAKQVVSDMAAFRQAKLDEDVKAMQAGGARAQNVLYRRYALLGDDITQIQQSLAEGKEQKWAQFSEDAMKVGEGDLAAPSDTASTQAALQEKVTQNQNLTHEEMLKNILSSVADDKDSWLGKIFYWLDEHGVGAGVAGVVGGAGISLGLKGIGKLFGGLWDKLRGGAGKAGDGASKLGEGGAKGFFAKIKSFFTKGGGATDDAAKIAAKNLGKIEAMEGVSDVLKSQLMRVEVGAADAATTAKMQEQLISAFKSGGDDAVMELAKDFKSQGLLGSTDDVAKALGGAADDLTEAGAKAADALDDIGKAGADAADDMAKSGGKFAQFMQKHFPKAASAFGKAGEFIAKHPALGKTLKIGGKALSVLNIVDTVADVGRGANKSEEWVKGRDASSKIASGMGSLIGGGEGGFGNAVGNAAKWAGIGAMVGGPFAPVTAAIGGVMGAVTGAIGGDKLARGFKWMQDKAQAANDYIDVWAEENLGMFGHAVTAVKNTFIDGVKNIGGGLFSGIGDLVSGIGGGFKKFIHGDFKEGLSTIGDGFVNAGKSVWGGITKAGEDIADDWTMSAKDRIAKREAELKALNGDLQDEQNNIEKSEDDLTKTAAKARSTSSGIASRSAKKFFTADTEGRHAVDNPSNPLGYDDPGVANILAHNSPGNYLSEDVPQTVDFSNGHSYEEESVEMSPAAAGGSMSGTWQELNKDEQSHESVGVEDMSTGTNLRDRGFEDSTSGMQDATEEASEGIDTNTAILAIAADLTGLRAELVDSVNTIRDKLIGVAEETESGGGEDKNKLSLLGVLGMGSPIFAIVKGVITAVGGVSNIFSEGFDFLKKEFFGDDKDDEKQGFFPTILSVGEAILDLLPLAKEFFVKTLEAQGVDISTLINNDEGTEEKDWTLFDQAYEGILGPPGHRADQIDIQNSPFAKGTPSWEGVNPLGTGGLAQGAKKEGGGWLSNLFSAFKTENPFENGMFGKKGVVGGLTAAKTAINQFDPQMAEVFKTGGQVDEEKADGLLGLLGVKKDSLLGKGQAGLQKGFDAINNGTDTLLGGMLAGDRLAGKFIAENTSIDEGLSAIWDKFKEFSLLDDAAGWVADNTQIDEKLSEWKDKTFGGMLKKSDEFYQKGHGILSDLGVNVGEAPLIDNGGLATKIEAAVAEQQADQERTNSVLSGVDTAGPDNISVPIVNSIDTNFSSVIGLLEKIASAVGSGGLNAKTEDKYRHHGITETRKPIEFGNKDNTGDMGILNYQNCG